jgi:ribosomal protein L37AE/L43A
LDRGAVDARRATVVTVAADDPTAAIAGGADRPPICPACGVTMVPADLSELDEPRGDWVCLECEETGAGGYVVT